VAIGSGCMRPPEPARTSRIEPPAPREIEAAMTARGARCSVNWGILFPGLAQLCLGEHDKAALLGGLGAAELTTGLVVAFQVGDDEGPDLGHPGAAFPLIAFQNVWVYGLSDAYITKALASRSLYAPRDTLGDLVLAPFNPHVLRRPSVWAGILATLAVGIGASLLIAGEVDTSEVGEDPNVFGRDFSPAVGYPLGFGIAGGLFSHVAIGEEALFRGVLQSGMARRLGENAGWVSASLIFGAAHLPNALAVEREHRLAFALIGVPVITAIGGYIGWAYRHEQYSLAPPVALHFWYDLLLSATFFVLQPQSSPISAGISLPF
jgi:membrane protease YdiL (CAAX protease family)